MVLNLLVKSAEKDFVSENNSNILHMEIYRRILLSTKRTVLMRYRWKLINALRKVDRTYIRWILKYALIGRFQVNSINWKNLKFAQTWSRLTVQLRLVQLHYHRLLQLHQQKRLLKVIQESYRH